MFYGIRSLTHEAGWCGTFRCCKHGSSETGCPRTKPCNYFPVLGLCVLFYAYNKWIKTSGYQLWIWRKPGWRVYLWFGVVVSCSVAAAIEGHAITAFKNIYFYHTGNPAILFLTSFVRDFLIALCAVAIAAKLSKTLGYGASRQPQPNTPLLESQLRNSTRGGARL